LKQAFFNVLSAIVDKAQKVVGAPRALLEIEIQSARTQEGVRISFRDDGPGLSSELRAALFEPGTTLAIAGVDGESALAVAQYVVVNQHRGRLFCEGEPGDGESAIVIELPEAQPASARTRVPAAR
jgi:signal transduction histidine kinase